MTVSCSENEGNSATKDNARMTLGALSSAPEQYGVGQEIDPLPATMSWVAVEYVDEHAKLVVGFYSDQKNAA